MSQVNNNKNNNNNENKNKNNNNNEKENVCDESIGNAKPRSLKEINSISSSLSSPIIMNPIQSSNFEIVFIDPLPNELQCGICLQVLRSPLKLNCQHHICANCISQTTCNQCAVCGKHIDKNSAKKDVELQNLIQQLAVKCSFFDNGCQWNGVLKHLQDHILQCNYVDVECSRQCGVTYSKNKEEEHLRNECSRRTTKCNFCHKDILANAIDVHQKICPYAIIDCPNDCGVTQMTREQICKHITNCPNAGSTCPFSEFGCHYRGDREMLQRHIREQPIRHLTLLCDGVLDLKMLLANMELSIEAVLRNMQLLHKKSSTLEKLYGSQMIWRIDNVKQKQNEARSGTRTTIFSQPFASARYGYKMIMSVSLYGDGQVRGEYMSAFISIMRGEYDAVLKWPFTNQITITLLDQNINSESNECNNIDYVIKPTAINAHKLFIERPISERNASFGAVKFCELDIVEKYIRDDVMFIKVHIHHNDYL